MANCSHNFVVHWRIMNHLLNSKLPSYQYLLSHNVLSNRLFAHEIVKGLSNHLCCCPSSTPHILIRPENMFVLIWHSCFTLFHLQVSNEALRSCVPSIHVTIHSIFAIRGLRSVELRQERPGLRTIRRVTSQTLLTILDEVLLLFRPSFPFPAEFS